MRDLSESATMSGALRSCNEVLIKTPGGMRPPLVSIVKNGVVIRAGT